MTEIEAKDKSAILDAANAEATRLNRLGKHDEAFWALEDALIKTGAGWMIPHGR